MRELALGLLRPGEIFRVAFKESTLGLINGIVLGILLGVVAYLWKGKLFLSFVIGAALAYSWCTLLHSLFMESELLKIASVIHVKGICNSGPKEATNFLYQEMSRKNYEDGCDVSI